MCGKCCHNLRLPLSIDEAFDWLQKGGEIQLFSEAIPWPEEPPEDNIQAQHKRRRSFAAMSGGLPIRVAVTLVATFDGPCPHLRPDMRCGAYETRPRVCRIYPAEVNPSIELDPSRKMCPPEAWGAGKPVFLHAGQLVDPAVTALIHQSRDADARDAPVKRDLCMRLGIATASLANEGFMIHSVDRFAALDALGDAIDALADSARAAQWRLISNRQKTHETLQEIGALAFMSGQVASAGMQYMGFFAADES